MADTDQNMIGGPTKWRRKADSREVKEAKVEFTVAESGVGVWALGRLRSEPVSKVDTGDPMSGLEKEGDERRTISGVASLLAQMRMPDTGGHMQPSYR